MIPVNRDTMIMVAAVVCLAGLIFLFKEVNKTKQEVVHMKDLSEYMSKKIEAFEQPKLITQAPPVETKDEKAAE